MCVQEPWDVGDYMEPDTTQIKSVFITCSNQTTPNVSSVGKTAPGPGDDTIDLNNKTMHVKT